MLSTYDVSAYLRGRSVPCASAVLLGDRVKKPDPTPDQIQDIIKKFTQKETEFAAARENYTYRQTSKMMEIRPARRRPMKW